MWIVGLEHFTSERQNVQAMVENINFDDNIVEEIQLEWSAWDGILLHAPLVMNRVNVKY